MPTTTTYQCRPVASLIPVAVASKSPYYPQPPKAASYSRISMSPPSASSSVKSSAVPSLTSGSTSSDHDSSNGARGVDLIDMMTDRLSIAVNPLPMDRSLARQAQTSGVLNAKQRELMELQALAQKRLKGARENLADGMKAATEVRRDLEWTQKRVSALNQKAARAYPTAHRTANARFPAAVDC